MNQEFSLNELRQTAATFAKLLNGYTAVAFHGDMGAGKTTFIAALCKALGSSDITGSPTFSIINQYITNDGKIIYHMDWYRVKDEEEAVQAGVEDALYSGNLCLVEWPEKAAGLLPEDTLHVNIATIDPYTRRITVNFLS